MSLHPAIIFLVGLVVMSVGAELRRYSPPATPRESSE
jgi:hypothetical protein